MKKQTVTALAEQAIANLAFVDANALASRNNDVVLTVVATIAQNTRHLCTLAKAYQKQNKSATVTELANGIALGCIAVQATADVLNYELLSRTDDNIITPEQRKNLTDSLLHLYNTHVACEILPVILTTATPGDTTFADMYRAVHNRDV